MAKARFVDPMLLLNTEPLPEGDAWQYELKVDGYRALAFKDRRQAAPALTQRQGLLGPVPRRAQGGCRSCRTTRCSTARWSRWMDEGQALLQRLQNFGSSKACPGYIFDLLMLAGKDVTRESLAKRRELLEKKILPKLRSPCVGSTRSMAVSATSLLPWRGAQSRGPDRFVNWKVGEVPNDTGSE
jgi:hypothetical protein